MRWDGGHFAKLTDGHFDKLTDGLAPMHIIHWLVHCWCSLYHATGQKRESPEVDEDEAPKEVAEQHAKKRGRPKGSKNKAKANPTKPTQNVRERSEKAADLN